MEFRARHQAVRSGPEAQEGAVGVGCDVVIAQVFGGGADDDDRSFKINDLTGS